MTGTPGVLVAADGWFGVSFTGCDGATGRPVEPLLPDPVPGDVGAQHLYRTRERARDDYR